VSVGNLMIFFSNLLWIHHLVHLIFGIKASNNETYTSESFVNDLKMLRNELEQRAGFRYIAIINNLLKSRTEVILNETKENINMPIFFSECLKDVQLVYKTHEYDLYISVLRKNSTEPMEGLIIPVRESDIKQAVYFLKRIKDVYLTIYIHSLPSDVCDFLLNIWKFDFIRHLSIRYHCPEIHRTRLKSETVVFVSILHGFRNLKILAMVNIQISVAQLEGMSKNVLLENLKLKDCDFCMKQSYQGPRSLSSIEFHDKYESICFTTCNVFVYNKEQMKWLYSPGFSIGINLSKCKNLRRLDVNSPYGVCIESKLNNLRCLRELHLCVMQRHLLSSPVHRAVKIFVDYCTE
ncbi:hypothetical protein THOM_3243, partial [Trachipleistophora hominis]